MKAIRLLLCVLVAFAQSAVANISSSKERAAEALSRQLMESVVSTEKKTLGDLIWKEIEVYDFTKQARKAFDELNDDADFVKFLESRGIDFDKLEMDKPASSNMLHLTLEYVGSSTNFSPSIAAWLTLIFNFDAPWETAQPLYLKVAKERPNDFVPKAVTLTRAVRTTEAASQWFALFKEAYASAQTARDKSLCLILLPSHAAYSAGIPGSEDHLRQVSDWLNDLEKQKTEEWSSEMQEISFVKFFVAVARKDYAAAAELSRGSRVRALEPLFLIIAGKFEEARTALKTLKNDSTLSQKERGILDSAAGILEVNEEKGK